MWYGSGGRGNGNGGGDDGDGLVVDGGRRRLELPVGVSWYQSQFRNELTD